MDTQWFDEEPYPGPAFRTARQEFEDLIDSFSSVGSGVADFGTHLHGVLFPRKSGISAAMASLVEAATEAEERMRRLEDREWSLVMPDYRTPPPPRRYGPPPKKRFSRRNRRTF